MTQNIIPTNINIKYYCDTVSFLKGTKDECIKIVEKDLEEHHALKDDGLIINVRQPSSAEECYFM